MTISLNVKNAAESFKRKVDGSEDEDMWNESTRRWWKKGIKDVNCGQRNQLAGNYDSAFAETRATPLPGSSVTGCRPASAHA